MVFGNLFKFISDKQKNVSQANIEKEISRLCEKLTTGVTELAETAKKINELKEKYSKASEMPDDTNTNPVNNSENENTQPKEKDSGTDIGSIVSSFFKSPPKEEPVPPIPPTPNVESPQSQPQDSLGEYSDLASSTPKSATEEYTPGDYAPIKSVDNYKPPSLDPMTPFPANDMLEDPELATPVATKEALPAAANVVPTAAGGKNKKS